MEKRESVCVLSKKKKKRMFEREAQKSKPPKSDRRDITETDFILLQNLSHFSLRGCFSCPENNAHCHVTTGKKFYRILWIVNFVHVGGKNPLTVM